MPTIAAVIGAPVRHSLSPAMHNAVFEATGLDWVFTRFEIAPGGARAAVEAMGVLGIGGYAVTMPHKQEAFESVDEVDPAAAALGAVNTVVLRGDGSTYAPAPTATASSSRCTHPVSRRRAAGSR